MALRQRKPTTASNRFTALSDFADLTKARPVRGLTEHRKRCSGRNSAGRITVRHRGGGHKRHYRLVDFLRDKHGIPARVVHLEYDPNRSARLALLAYKDGEKRYILAPAGLHAGMTVLSGPAAEPAVGNALQLKSVPVGTFIHNIESLPGSGAKLVRTAGAGAQMMARDGEYANVKMPSGEIRKLHVECYAVMGHVGNSEHETKSLGKAGRKRWMGIRPTVRGVCMNPIDHPNGGGEGRSKSGGGRQHLMSPWGKLARGKKTRARNNPTGKFIVQRRK